MASPSRKRKVEVRFCCCCSAAATDPGALLSPTPCFPLLPSRGQSAVEFLLEGSRILGCPKRTTSTARPFSVWTGACYWHGVGGSMFNSSSSS